MRNILVIGANYENQGAFLMLCAVSEELKRRFGGRVVLDRHQAADPRGRFIDPAGLLPAKLDRPGLRGVAKALPGAWVSRGEVDAVFDVSGFRYGDQWSRLDLQGSARRLQEWRDRGVPVYLLPQAFGPFESTGDASGAAMDAANIVFPRDPDSLAFVQSLQIARGAAWAVERSPDFTGGVRGELPAGLGHLAGRIPIVPNRQIAERSRAEHGTAYQDNLVRIVTHLIERGERPYGLSHETNGDAALLKDIASSVADFEVVAGYDGRQLKAILGTASVVVSARYHAIASSLSQGVPTLCHSWSHKYKWLADDYGVRDFVVDPVSDADAQIVVLDRLRQEREDLSLRIRQNAGLVEETVTRMWDTVVADMDASRP